jgi:hypothetical protein
MCETCRKIDPTFTTPLEYVEEESHEEYMDRVHGAGNWTVCWHDKDTQRPVTKGTPNSEKVWHHKAFHDTPKEVMPSALHSAGIPATAAVTTPAPNELCSHTWLPWLEIEAKGLSDLYEGDMATESYITRCANCGKRERWNV